MIQKLLPSVGLKDDSTTTAVWERTVRGSCQADSAIDDGSSERTVADFLDPTRVVPDVGDTAAGAPDVDDFGQSVEDADAQQRPELLETAADYHHANGADDRENLRVIDANYGAGAEAYVLSEDARGRHWITTFYYDNGEDRSLVDDDEMCPLDANGIPGNGKERCEGDPEG